MRESDVLTIHDASGLLGPALTETTRGIGGTIPIWFT